MANIPTAAEPEKPQRPWFQFSLRDLLIAVTCWCVAAGNFFLSIWLGDQRLPWPAIFCFLGTGAIICGGIGKLFGHVWLGATIGLIAWIIGWAILITSMRRVFLEWMVSENRKRVCLPHPPASGVSVIRKLIYHEECSPPQRAGPFVSGL